MQSLRSVGVKASQVMDHMLDQSESYEVVEHTRKDLYNRLNTIRRYFGDVMSFDSTYQTNPYNRPLVIFIGVNNHTKTIVFGFGLLADEIVDTYTLILKTFLEAMHGKSLISVVTDGDKAMSKAIMLVMPNVVHHLCSWHLVQNVQTNVGDTGFTQDFTHYMFTYLASQNSRLSG
ncbi:hypothetical protein Ddye_007755 [Dipteronia dyeriana]|uniref:MULE transposase domain-containing protein n=1 Tax=Dipteronia dyeriana TaxID=168575 RepID=A0AAD9XKT6_9ROSI|nr:hypothetical protein Ddye_007755 [Dipteronia dyeriana]